MQKHQQKLEADAAKKIGEDPKMTKTQPQNPLYLQVTLVVCHQMKHLALKPLNLAFWSREHKDVAKVSGPLHTSVTSLKTESDKVSCRKWRCGFFNYSVAFRFWKPSHVSASYGTRILTSASKLLKKRI